MSKTVPIEKRLCNKEVWDSIVPGDLIQFEGIDERRDALLVKLVSHDEISTIKLSTGYSHTIFRNSCGFYWI
jgi:hypothetical protein